MPELPEVEALVRTLRDSGLEGARVLQLQVLRPSVVRPQNPAELERLTIQQRITKAERRAKNILLHLSNKHVIRVHLRMTGDLLLISNKSAQKNGTQELLAKPSTRIVWQLSGQRYLVFRDSRALGKVHIYSEERLAELFSDLGPEPLTREFTKARFLEIAAKSRLPAKLFLMDQSKIAGLGNIYVAEVLFRSCIHPRKPINQIPPAKLESLHGEIKEVLRSAVQSIYKAYRSPEGFRNHNDDFERFVYGLAGKPCKVCGNKIQRITQGGRSTYFCPHCQR